MALIAKCMPPLMAQNSTIWGILSEKIPKIENFGAELVQKENPEMEANEEKESAE
jgi:hypothetical protein